MEISELTMNLLLVAMTGRLATITFFEFILYTAIIDFFRVKRRNVTTNYNIVIAFQNVTY